MCLQGRPLRDALTHTLAGGMSHTEVNHTYSLALSPSRSKTSAPVFLLPQKNQTETRGPDSSTPTTTSLDSSNHPMSRPPSRSCRCFKMPASRACRETSGAGLVFVFHFRLPPYVTLPIMISFVAWNHGNLWPLPLCILFSHHPLQEHELSVCLPVWYVHKHTHTVPLSDTAHC